MEVKVLFFAQLEELFGVSEMKIEDVENILEVVEYLIKIQPKLKDYSYTIAVNEQLNQRGVLLKNNDTIALLPPFAGG